RERRYAPTASDRLAPRLSAPRPGAQQRLWPTAGICGGEGSLAPPGAMRAGRMLATTQHYQECCTGRKERIGPASSLSPFWIPTLGISAGHRYFVGRSAFALMKAKATTAPN